VDSERIKPNVALGRNHPRPIVQLSGDIRGSFFLPEQQSDLQ
jgi:hypothetical protein